MKSGEPLLHPIKTPRSPMWYIEVWHRETRTRQRISLGVTREEDVPNAIESFRRDILPGLISEQRAQIPVRDAGDSPPLRSLLDWYIDAYLPPRAKPRTVQKYAQVLSTLAQFCRLNHIGRPDQLSLRKLEEWTAWLDGNGRGRDNGRRASKSRRDALAIVRAFLNASVRHGELRESPIRYWEIPRARSRHHEALNASALAECLALIQARSPSISNIIHFLAASGWRVSDAMDLRWNEVELRRGEIGSSIDREQIKTGDRLNYPVTPIIREILQRELDRTRESQISTRTMSRTHVFTNAQGQPWSYNTLYRRLERTLARAGFPVRVTPHTFRATFATLAARAGVQPRVLQNLLGHSDLKMTLEFYTHVDLNDLRAAAEHVNNFANDH